MAEKAVRQHVEASFAALDARLEQALGSAAAAIEASGEPSLACPAPSCMYRNI